MQDAIGVSVTGAVRVDLPFPPIRIGLWPARVQRTAMPEAAVDEDGEPGTRKGNIDRPSRPTGHRRKDSKSHSVSVKSASQQQFWSCVAPPLP
jgi:hypothetical protein